MKKGNTNSETKGDIKKSEKVKTEIITSKIT